MSIQDPKPTPPAGLSEIDLSPVARYYMPDSPRRRYLSAAATDYHNALRMWEQRQRQRNRYRAKPEIFRELNARRGARLRTAAPRWDAPAVMRRLYVEAQKRKMEVDHVVPLSSPHVCGLHVWHNLQLLEKTENIRKGNREWPDQWEPVNAWREVAQ